MALTPGGFFVFSFSFFATAKIEMDEQLRIERKSRSFQDLLAWQKAILLAKNIYHYTQSFPKEETYGLRQQARRAVVSISSNIAEGQARNGINEFIQFLGIANGSLAELKTHLFISEKLGFGQSSVVDRLVKECDSVAQLLNGLKISLQKTKNEKRKTFF